MPAPTLEDIQALNASLNMQVAKAAEVCTFSGKREDFEVWFRLAGRKLELEQHLHGQISPDASQAVGVLANLGISQGVVEDGREAASWLAEGRASSREWLAGGPP